MVARPYVALLRGINVGGHNKVPMPALRELFESLGHGDVRTYVQSGNVGFDSKEADPMRLRTSIERALADDLGVPVTCLVRSAADIAAVVAGDPFAGLGLLGKHVFVLFCERQLDAAGVDALAPEDAAPEAYHVGRRELYVSLPNGVQKAKLLAAFSERRLGQLTTSRNWNTVLALHEMLANAAA